MGPVTLATHTIVKQIIDFMLALFGAFSTATQSLVATCLGRVRLAQYPCTLWCQRLIFSRWSPQKRTRQGGAAA